MVSMAIAISLLSLLRYLFKRRREEKEEAKKAVRHSMCRRQRRNNPAEIRSAA